MLENVLLKNVMFIDIETVPCASSLEELGERHANLWDKKAERINKYREEKLSSAELFFERGAIYPEFGKIVCISAGVFKETEDSRQFRIKSFYSDDEKQILEEFQETLDNNYSINKNYLCAHNGKEFDFPYIARRCLINGVRLPQMLDISGKKPWETKHLLDTLELWRFGDFKNYTSLDLLATVFNVETPKDDIKGEDVAHVYWKDNDINRIKNYCEKDILTLARVFMHYKGILPMPDEEIIYTEENKEAQ